MGAMGRYIDGLDDASRDRLIEAQGWRALTLQDGQGNGCLMGNARGLGQRHNLQVVVGLAWIEATGGFATVYDDSRRDCRQHPAAAFNYSCLRFGKDRVVRAIKKRAARGNHISLPESPVPVEQKA